MADVALDGKTLLHGFKFQHVTDVLTVPAGKHRVQIYKTRTTTDPQLDVAVDLKAGQDLTAVAALGEGDEPQAFVFDNRLPKAFDSPRAVVLRNATAAGPMTLTVGGTEQDAVAAGKQGVYELAAGGQRVRVDASSGSRVGKAFGAKVPAGRMLSVVVVGGTDAEKLFLVTAQQRPGGADTTVSDVPTGGQPPANTLWPAGVLVLAGALLLGWAVVRRPRHAARP